jgi:potassium uptake TrkH family protein
MRGKKPFLNLWQGKSKGAYLFRKVQQILLLICNTAIPFLLILAVGLVIYDFGFKPFWKNSYDLNSWMQVLLNLLSLLIGIRLLAELFLPKKKWTRILNFSGWVIILFVTLFILPQKDSMINTDTNRFLIYKIVLYTVVVSAFITEASYLLQFIYHRKINPAVLFVASFAALVFIGAFMLMLPNATTRELSFLDALFTATSAVCVTGLAVVDTATHFTPFGQFLILLLIQIGALGIMTFATLLAYAFAGSSSLRSELALRDMMSTEQVANVIHFVYRVVLITLFFEFLGAVSIYFSLPDEMFDRKLDRAFFSIFHAVSAFCNAGFSTLTNGLYEPVVRYNYILQFFIALLIILGGMGFPIVFNLFRFIKIKATNLHLFLRRDPRRVYLPKIIGMNARLALVVSGYLLLIGFFSYLVFEQSATLTQHPTLIGKVVTSFFGSVTPRTAGFNTVDMTALSLPTIMIYLLLMWIGASPGSTGGGIRTTTAGVAILNAVSILRGKDRVEFFRSEISQQSIRRAFTIMLLSFLLIGLSTFLITINDSDKGLIRIAFEVFSAYSTVGLSLGLTPQLSQASRVVLIVSMFVGRVGMITLLVAFVKQSQQLYYRYPKEEVVF